jgi:hypothetical protein
MRKLGVFEVEQFFPEKDRMKLAMQLNGLLASPSFAAWMKGPDLDIESLLWRDGKPQAAIMYIAHLSDTERQFVTTMIFSKLITWMRSQPGSGDLRVLAYMDEVFGFVPPTAQPPAKKPILTILKQARAFGVGLLLSTQNPVDLDYKAMSNAGTWCIGRLQTERDKARIIEALTTATGAIDIDEMDERISNLPKRAFVMHSVREKVPTVMTTRWAMSYLRGPMTREEVSRFREPDLAAETKMPEVAPSRDQATTPPAPTSVGPPDIAPGVESVAIHPAAPWRGRVGDLDGGTHYRAAFAVSVELRFDETRLGLDIVEPWEAIIVDPALESRGAIIEVDHDERDFVAPDASIPVLPVGSPVSQEGFFRSLERDLRNYLDRTETVDLWRNRELRMVSRPNETEDAFVDRCKVAAQDRADQAKTKLIAKYEPRIRKAKRAHEDAVSDATLAEQAADDEQQSAMLGFGLDLLMGRKARLPSSRTRTSRKRARRAESTIARKRAAYEDLVEDLEDGVADLDDSWDAKAAEIEAVNVGLESDDITIVKTRVVWVRTMPDAEGIG